MSGKPYRGRVENLAVALLPEVDHFECILSLLPIVLGKFPHFLGGNMLCFKHGIRSKGDVQYPCCTISKFSLVLEKENTLLKEWGAGLVKMHFKTINHLKDLTEGHILYFFENEEDYINHVKDFVISGLEQNQYSIIIENDRINLMLKKKLEPILKHSQSNQVFIINNFDFYYAKGDFQCNSIFDYLPHLIDGYSPEGFAVRSWAHVEWGDEREMDKKLSISEKEADGIVRENNLLSVCAYDSYRVSEQLKGNLLNRHNYLLSDYTSKPEANEARIL